MAAVKPRSMVTIIAALCLFAASMSCGEDDFEFQQTITFPVQLSVNGTFDTAAGELSQTDETRPVAAGVDLKLSETSPQLQEYADGNLFSEMRIDAIKYTVINNSVTTDIEAIDVAFGPLGTVSPSDDDAVLLATLPAIPAGETPEGEADIIRENAAALSKHVFGLDFGMTGGTELSVRQGEPTPGGTIRVDVEIVMTLIADPL